MTELFADMTFWHWFIFGGVLLIVEMLVPSTLFLWPVVAAFIVGVLKLIIPALTGPAAVAIWAILSVVTVVGWTKYRKAHPAPKNDNGLNQRGHEFIGRVFTLDKPIVNGKGEIHTADTVWKVLCAHDLTAGMSVVVTGVEGTLLRVMPAERD